MEPNWFGWIMVAIFVGTLLAGLTLWGTLTFLTARHFIYLRRASPDWRSFSQRFRVGNARNVRSILPAPGIRNLDLALKLHKASWVIFVVGGAAFALGTIWGGWSGQH